MKDQLIAKIGILLKEFPKYWEGEQLLRSRVIDDLKSYNPDLLGMLLNDNEIRAMYGVEIAGNLIFKIDEFVSMLRFKSYWENSYTKYQNKIGLTSEGKYLDYNSDVVLDFPYKDTVLEGGMTKEDKGKKEIYYNKVIAKAQIDRLLEPKVFKNVKKYDGKGKCGVDLFSAKDNLIIKGNNLIALHSLKNQFAGEVKMIYIDPPYNTGGDSFRYNDRFNHSTWLTFMKNRLEIARELLTEDGAIFIQTDDVEQAYLKVLMDEVFGRDNYINTVSVLFKNTAGVSGGGEDKRLKKNIEYITIYTKNYDIHKGFNSIYSYVSISELVKQYREEGVSWKYTTALIDEGEKVYVGSTYDGSGDEIKIYNRINAQTKSISQLMREENLTEEEAYSKYSHALFQTTNAQTSIRQRVIDFVSSHEDISDTLSIEYVPKSGRNKGKVYEQFYKGGKCRLFAWLRDVTDTVDEELVKKDSLGTFWDLVASTKNVNKEGKVEFSNGKKPEDLILKMIEMATNEGDLVLDFFMGSATTQAVAMKMDRQFIGIEQMDYIESVSLPRLQKVIEGEQSGISKDVEWQGGGSFVYAELHDLNNEYVEKIQKASNEVYIIQLIDELKGNAYLDFQVKIDQVTQSDNTFLELSLAEKKQVLLDLLDMNQLYLNYSEINDEQFNVADIDRRFNESFYGDTGLLEK